VVHDQVRDRERIRSFHLQASIDLIGSYVTSDFTLSAGSGGSGTISPTPSAGDQPPRASQAGAGAVQGFLPLVTRDGSFEFYEPYLRRSIYGFKKKQLQLAASSARGIEFMQKQVSVKLPQGSQMATLTLGIEATLRNVG
jgi:hypothetical protein